MVKKIYMSFSEGKGPGTVASPQLAGAGLAFNYVLQLLISVLGGGYATGTAEARTGGMESIAALRTVTDVRNSINEWQQSHHSDDGGDLAVE